MMEKKCPAESPYDDTWEKWLPGEREKDKFSHPEEKVPEARGQECPGAPSWWIPPLQSPGLSLVFTGSEQ